MKLFAWYFSGAIRCRRQRLQSRGRRQCWQENCPGCCCPERPGTQGTSRCRPRRLCPSPPALRRSSLRCLQFVGCTRCLCLVRPVRPGVHSRSRDRSPRIQRAHSHPLDQLPDLSWPWQTTIFKASLDLFTRLSNIICYIYSLSILVLKQLTNQSNCIKL